MPAKSALLKVSRDDWPADRYFPVDFCQRVKFWYAGFFKNDC